jgi:anti-anti-sigma factor
MAEYRTTHEGPVTILEIHGRIEPDNWQELNGVFKKITDSPETKHLVVDLAALEYTASAGFRELFMAGRALSRKGGHLAVCSLQGEVKRVFDLAGFATAYPIFDDRTSAIASFPQN